MSSNESVPDTTASHESVPDKTGAPTRVADNPALQRVEIAVPVTEGAEPTVVGFALYRDRTDADTTQRIFFHTEVEEAFGGRGLGTILVRGALDAARDAGLRVVPVCPLFAAYVKKHDDVADIIDRATPDIMAYLREHTA